MNIAILLTLLLIVAVVLLIPRRVDFLTDCETLVSQLTPADYTDLEAYAIESPTSKGGFWMTSGRLPGALSRIRRSTICVRLVQVHVRANRISLEDARYIWIRFALQSWFSAWTLPEMALCLVVKDLPHICARMAFTFHYELILRTETLCVTQGAPNCVLQLTELL